MVMSIFVITVCSIIFLALLTLMSIAIYISRMFIKQRINQEQRESLDFGISSERVTIKTDDKINLAAWRTKSSKAGTKGTIVIISGMENPSVTQYFGFAKMFADNGWDSLLIEMRCRGLSEGKSTGIGMTEWLDVKAGVDFLSEDERAKAAPIVVMGTSMGGATVITAAGEVDRTNAVIALSAFSSVVNMLGDVLPRFGIPKFVATLLKPFVNMVLRFRLGFGTIKYTPISGIKKLGKRPLLLMHSTEDDSVPYSQYIKLLTVAKQNNINVVEFERKGNHHFVFVSELESPTTDIEFCEVINGFLETVSDCR